MAKQFVIAFRVFTLLLIASVSGAQSDDLNFINFSNKDGLSANAVNVILKDQYGYMWFGTDDGLNKFDGESFTVYRHNVSNKSSIGFNKINAICEDKQGNLWVGTNESLSFYDRKKDAFTNYNIADKALIRSLCFDHKGNLWIGSYGGLFIMNLQSGSVKAFKAIPGKQDQLLSNIIVSLFEDSKQRMWIGTNQGLHLYLRESNNFQRFRHSVTDSFSIADNVIRSIAEDKNGAIWIGTNDGGVSSLRADGKSFNNYHHNPSNTNSISSNCIFALRADNSGQLWIGTEEGLNIFDPVTSKISRVDSDPRNKYSITGKSVRSIYIDKNGIYWVGTFQGGVSKYDKNLVLFNLRQSNLFDEYGLSSPVVTSLLEDNDGDIYVGTDGGGLNHFHRKTGLFSHPKILPGNGNKSLTILSMEKVGNQLWLGTYRQGLFVLDIKTGAVRQYKKGNGPNDLSGNDVFSLKKDRNGNMWVGFNGEGVNVFNPHNEIIYRFLKDDKNTSKLPSNGFIRSIEEDVRGNIWIGSNGSGIAIFNPSLMSFTQLNRYNSNLPSNNVSDIHVDHSGIVWVGTLGGGLSRMNDNFKFVSYSEAEGLSNDVVYKILESDSNKLWVSTNKGISSFDRKHKRFKNYTHQNGLQKSTFWPGAGLKTSTGDLFFGGLDGFNFFNPQTLKCNKVIPPLVFTDLKISNRSVVPGAKEAIKENISVADKITLAHKQNFSLDFVALNYTSPQDNRYSYKLEGFDKDWNQVGTSRKAVYTNLDPGSYTFRLRATSDDGMWNSPEKSLTIFVKPPFWRTSYAYIFYACFVGCFLIVWRYWGIHKLKNKFALDQERQMARQEHEFDQLKIKFLTNLSHEFRTPVSLIVGPLEKMLTQETNESKVKQITMVKRNARRLLNLVNQLLDFRKLETNELKLSLAEGDIISFVKDIAESFRDISETKDIRFSFFSSIDHLYMSFDKDKIERVLFNLLSNAFKFTDRQGEIALKVERGLDSTLKIAVSDTGIGIAKENRDKIFDRFYQDDTNVAVLNQGSGIGLSITREFVKLHGGTIDIDSAPGIGSVFTVSLPYTEIQKPVEQVVGTTQLIIETQIEKVAEADKFTVLLVEDNDDFRTYLKENLESYYKIIEAANGKEGWQKVLSAHPQVVVSDISMPHMDGIALSQKMKSDKRTSHIPVILLTALTGENNHMIGLRSGAVDYLTKPFNFELLNVKIRNILGLNENFKNTYSRHIKIDTPVVAVQSDDEKLMLNITKYLEENIDSPDLSVEELSKHLFMSRGSLYSKIVVMTGETPVEFIRSFRLNKAAELLEHSDMKIAEIGYAVGFATPNYFTRAFKAKFNISPSDYCKLKTNGK